MVMEMLLEDLVKLFGKRFSHLKHERMVIDATIQYSPSSQTEQIHHVLHGGQGEGVHGEGGHRFRKKSIWADNFPFAPTYQKFGALASKT